MTLLEALLSGCKYKRKNESMFWDADENTKVDIFSIDDVLAKDWEVIETETREF